MIIRFSDWEKVNIIFLKQMNIINVVCGYAGSAELTFTTFSLHQKKKIFCPSILENLDLENPRSIYQINEKKEMYGWLNTPLKSTGTRDELSITLCICNLKSISVLSGCLSMPDATSLHHCLQNHHQYCIILSWIRALNINRPIVNLAEAGL